MMTGMRAVTPIRMRDGRKLTMSSGSWKVSWPRISFRISLAWVARISGAVKKTQMRTRRTLPQNDQRVSHFLFFYECINRHSIKSLCSWFTHLQVLPVNVPWWRGKRDLPALRL